MNLRSLSIGASRTALATRWFDPLFCPLPACLLLALLSTPSLLRAQCNPGDILVGEDSERYYCMSREKYAGSKAEGYAKTYHDASLKVSALQNAFHAMGFKLDAERFDLYRGVAEKQKEEMEEKILNALLDQALDASVEVAGQAKSLNPWNVNDAIHLLEGRGADFEPLVAALRTIARQKNKPAMAAAYREFIAGAKAAKEGWDTHADGEKDPDNKRLRFLLGALKTMQTDPRLGLVVTTVDFGENLVYLGYLSGQVDDLGNLTDDKLKQLPDLTQKLKDAVATANTAKSSWRTETGFQKATPIWGSNPAE